MCHKSGKRWQIGAEGDAQKRFKLVGVEFFLHFSTFLCGLCFKGARQTAGTAHR